MHKRILAICLAIFLAFAVIPTGFADSSDQVVITYGETAYMNQQYKSIVDDYFASKTNVDINSINSKVVTAGDVNKISGGFSGKQYNSNQIFSSALLDLNQNGEITVEVDSSITTITPEMYMSALKSAGIQGGHVYVTSPVSATGESALAGIMNCYDFDKTLCTTDMQNYDFITFYFVFPVLSHESSILQLNASKQKSACDSSSNHKRFSFLL